MGELIYTFLSSIFSGYFNKKSANEALEKFLTTFSQPNHDPRLVEYFFALATHHRYGKYNEILLMMNTRYPLATIWMFKDVNRIMPVVKFKEDGTAEVTSRTGWLTKIQLFFVTILFAITLVFGTTWIINDIISIYKIIGHSEITYTMVRNVLMSGCISVSSFFVLSLAVYCVWEIEGARPFVEYYNSHRNNSVQTH